MLLVRKLSVIAYACILFSAVCTANSSASEEVRFTTVDGFELVGDFHEGTKDGATVIMLHQLGSDRSEFKGLARGVNNAGYHVLAYDARGHGQSVKKDGKKATWNDFTNPMFQEMVRDIEAAVYFLRDRYGIRGPFGIVGSSIQSSTSLVYAARERSVHALVMLSPGLDYRGIFTDDPMREYKGRPVFIIASEGDEKSKEAAEKLKSIAGEKAFLLMLGGSAHGMKMSSAEPALTLKIGTWLDDNLK